MYRSVALHARVLIISPPSTRPHTGEDASSSSIYTISYKRLKDRGGLTKPKYYINTYISVAEAIDKIIIHTVPLKDIILVEEKNYI